MEILLPWNSKAIGFNTHTRHCVATVDKLLACHWLTPLIRSVKLLQLACSKINHHRPDSYQGCWSATKTEKRSLERLFPATLKLIPVSWRAILRKEEAIIKSDIFRISWGKPLHQQNTAVIITIDYHTKFHKLDWSAPQCRHSELSMGRVDPHESGQVGSSMI